MIQCVEGVCAVGGCKRVVPVSSPAETSVERNVASTDEEDSRRTKDQSERDKGSIVQELIADGSVHEEDPCGRNDGSNVYSREGLNLSASTDRRVSYQYRLTRRTAPSRGNQPMVKISQIEMMMKPRRNSCISLGEWSACVDSCTARGQVYLLPTAARFLFDLQMRKRAMRMARPSINMEPKLARYLPPPSEIPLRSHPPKPAPPRDGDSLKSCRKESIGSEGSEGGEVVVHYTLAVSIASCLCRDRSPVDAMLDSTILVT